MIRFAQHQSLVPSLPAHSSLSLRTHPSESKTGRLGTQYLALASYGLSAMDYQLQPEVV